MLSGRKPPDDVGAKSDLLQIWYNNTNESWVGDGEDLHMHTSSDECFVVLRGNLVVEVEGERYDIGPRKFCSFPRGVYHVYSEESPGTSLDRYGATDFRYTLDLQKTQQ